jgi:hypothetical protein
MGAESLKPQFRNAARINGLWYPRGDKDLLPSITARNPGMRFVGRAYLAIRAGNCTTRDGTLSDRFSAWA